MPRRTRRNAPSCPEFECTLTLTHTCFVTLHKCKSVRNLSALENIQAYLDANGNIREHPQPHPRSLNDLYFALDDLLRRCELLRADTNSISADTYAPLAICKSSAFRRTTNGNRDGALLPLRVRRVLRRELVAVSDLLLLYLQRQALALALARCCLD
jgi:hypothetical protein